MMVRQQGVVDITQNCLDTLNPQECQKYCVQYLVHRYIDDTSRNNFDTLASQFVGGRRIMAGFYAMIIIVRCGRTGQVLVLDG